MLRFTGFFADQPVFNFCPDIAVDTGDIDNISFVLKHPNNPQPLEQEDSVITSFPTYVLTLQKATGISMDEFHVLFTQSDEPACFSTPYDIWPK